MIRRDRLSRLIPDLIDALGDPKSIPVPTVPANDDDSARSVILDALIQLSADVPAPISAALFARYPAEATILMSHSSKSAAGPLLEILAQGKTDECWLAAGNLLTGGREPGTAASLLRQLRLEGTVSVSEFSGEIRLPDGVVGGCTGGVIGGVLFMNLCHARGLPGTVKYWLLTPIRPDVERKVSVRCG